MVGGDRGTLQVRTTVGAQGLVVARPAGNQPALELGPDRRPPGQPEPEPPSGIQVGAKVKVPYLDKYVVSLAWWPGMGFGFRPKRNVSFVPPAASFW
jgi:hypothetical protein